MLPSILTEGCVEQLDSKYSSEGKFICGFQSQLLSMMMPFWDLTLSRVDRRLLELAVIRPVW